MIKNISLSAAGARASERERRRKQLPGERRVRSRRLLGNPERPVLLVLSRAISGHHLRDTSSAKATVLRIQPHTTLLAHQWHW